MLIEPDDIDVAIGDEVYYRVDPCGVSRRGVIAGSHWLAGAEFFEIHEVDLTSLKPTGEVHKIPGQQILSIVTEQDDYNAAYDRAMGMIL